MKSTIVYVSSNEKRVLKLLSNYLKKDEDKKVWYNKHFAVNNLTSTIDSTNGMTQLNISHPQNFKIAQNKMDYKTLEFLLSSIPD